MGPDKQFKKPPPSTRLGVALGEFTKLVAVIMRPKSPEEVSVGHIHGVPMSMPEQVGKVLDSSWLTNEGTWLTFTQLASECCVSMEVVGRFLALLELYRAKTVDVEQEEALEEIHVAQTGLGVGPAVVAAANQGQMACVDCWADFELGLSWAGLSLARLGWAGLG